MLSLNLPPKRFVALRGRTKKFMNEGEEVYNTITREEAEKHSSNGNNVGFLLGEGYVAFDCDTKEMEEAVEKEIGVETYTQLSANRGMRHYLYKINGFDESLTLDNGKEKENKVTYGEILCSKKQLVLYPSKFNGKEYKILKDVPIAEIPISKIMNLIEKFHSELDEKWKETEKQTKQFYEKAGIDDISITSVISTAGMKQTEKGQYVGSNPWHDSTSGENFRITPNKNLGYCFRCKKAISPAKAIALNEGIIHNCYDELRGDKFIEVIEIAKKKYGLKDEFITPLNDNEVTPLEFWTMEDYENYKPSTEFIIQDILYPREIDMNYGGSGKFKSLHMLYKAICIASGKKYLGKFKVKKCNVGILSAENSKDTDKKRLREIRRGLNLRKRNLPLYILPRNKCEDIMSISFRKRLYKTIKEKEIRVLFLDTITPLTPEIDDNKAKDVMRVFNEVLKTLVDEYGCSVEFLSHTDKKEYSYLGSIKWKGLSDVVTRIERNGLERKFKLFNEKGRDGELNVLEIGIEFLDNKIEFKLLGESSPQIYNKTKKKNKSDNLRDKILELNLQDKSRKEIFQVLKDKSIPFSRATIDRVLKSLGESQ